MRKSRSPAMLPLTGLFSLIVAQAFSIQAGAADSSVDSLWNEQPQPGATTAAGGAPLCSVDSFKQSPLVQTGAWPGVGPFRGDGPQMTDASQNRLAVQIDKANITNAEMTVSDKPRQLIKMQIAADFLLESIGATPAKISEFNAQFAKSKSDLTASSQKAPLALSVDRYNVSIYPESAHNDMVNFVIRVSGKDGMPAAPPHAVAMTPAPVVPEAPVQTALSAGPDPVETAPPVVPSKPKHNTAPDTIKMSIIPPPPSTAITAVSPPANPAETVNTPNTPAATVPVAIASIGKTTSPPPTASVPTAPELKSEFTNLITKWQSLKKAAVKERDSSSLFQVLGGKALARQTDAIKWLVTNQKHYDMSAKNINVDRYTELAPGEKYSVYAQLTEMSKYIDDGTSPSQVLKDTTLTYSVIYTVEKVDGRWVITDSALPPAPTSNQPQSAAKPSNNASR